MAKHEINAVPVYETALQQENLQALSGDVQVDELRHYGFIVLRVRPETAGVVEAMQQLGIELPKALQWTGSLDTCLVKWISPDEFLVTLPLAEKDAFMQQAKTALQGIFSAVVDNSGAYALLKFSGRQYQDLLAKLCLYDLRHELLVGKVVSSLLGKTGAIFYRLDDTSLLCMVRWSFAAYAWRALVTASQRLEST